MSESSVAVTGSGDPSARIKRVPAPIASPGNCVICGKNEHPLGFAQTDNLDFEFYGTVYFCADCVGDYARVFGFLAPSEVTAFREHIEAQDRELNTLRQAVLGLESTVDGLVADAHRRSSKRADDISRSRNEHASISSSSDPVDEPDEGLPEQDSGKPDKLPQRVEPNPAQPVAEQGTDDVFDTTSADELLGL